MLKISLCITTLKWFITFYVSAVKITFDCSIPEIRLPQCCDKNSSLEGLWEPSVLVPRKVFRRVAEWWRWLLCLQQPLLCLFQHLGVPYIHMSLHCRAATLCPITAMPLLAEKDYSVTIQFCCLWKYLQRKLITWKKAVWTFPQILHKWTGKYWLRKKSCAVDMCTICCQLGKLFYIISDHYCLYFANYWHVSEVPINFCPEDLMHSYYHRSS